MTLLSIEFNGLVAFATLKRVYSMNVDANNSLNHDMVVDRSLKLIRNFDLVSIMFITGNSFI